MMRTTTTTMIIDNTARIYRIQAQLLLDIAMRRQMYHDHDAQVCTSLDNDYGNWRRVGARFCK